MVLKIKRTKARSPLSRHAHTLPCIQRSKVITIYKNAHGQALLTQQNTTDTDTTTTIPITPSSQSGTFIQRHAALDSLRDPFGLLGLPARWPGHVCQGLLSLQSHIDYLCIIGRLAPRALSDCQRRRLAPNHHGEAPVWQDSAHACRRVAKVIRGKLRYSDVKLKRKVFDAH